MTKTPNIDQLAAIIRFADAHGRNWKSKLSDCWLIGYYPAMAIIDCDNGDDALLQQVRNQFGPSWLKSFRLTDAVRDQNMRDRHEWDEYMREQFESGAMEDTPSVTPWFAAA
jgi:hypothetical protein